MSNKKGYYFISKLVSLLKQQNRLRFFIDEEKHFFFFLRILKIIDVHFSSDLTAAGRII